MTGFHPAVDVLVAAALAGSAIAAGARVRGLCGFPLRPGLRLAVDFVVGSWVLGVIVTILGIAHAWRPWLLAAVALGVVAGGRWRRNGWQWTDLVWPVAGASLALPVTFARPFFYDALVYHLGLPWQGLLEGGLHAHAEDLFSTFPPLAQLMATIPLALGLDRAPALLHWCSFIAAGVGAAAVARALGAPRWARRLVAGCVPLLPGDVLVAGLPAAEGYALAGMLTAAALVLDFRVSAKSAALAGLLAGTAAAARLQAVPWGAILIALVAVQSPRTWRAGLAAAAGAVAGSAPWWFKNLVLLGEPFAPIGWSREGVATLWRDGNVLLGQGGSLRAGLGQVFTAVAPHTFYLGPLALAAALTVVSRRDRPVRITVALVGTALLTWGFAGTLPRFLAPAVAMLAALAAASAGAGMMGRWAAGLSLGVVAATGVVLTVGALGRIGSRQAFTGAGVVDPKFVANDSRPAFAAAGRLPTVARVLFVGEPRGFGFPRPFVAPSQHDVSPVRPVLEASSSPAEAGRRLRQQGFTHILVNWGELSRLAGGYPVAPWRDPAGWRRWNTFVASLGPPALEAAGVQVFVLPTESTR